MTQSKHTPDTTTIHRRVARRLKGKYKDMWAAEWNIGTFGAIKIVGFYETKEQGEVALEAAIVKARGRS